MSALLHLGEAQHRLLQADTEIEHSTDDPLDTCALVRARHEITKARAALAAVQLALRTQAMFDVLEHHEEMALRLREGARLQRVPAGRGLHAVADRHEQFARALRVLVGTTETTADEKGGEPCHVV